MQKRVLMADVARAAQVSKTTVSLVLNDIPGTRIPEATRARVFRAAQEIGYRHLRGPEHADDAGATVVGVLINEISAAYPINLLDGLETAAEARDVRLVVQIVGGGPEPERDALRLLHRMGAGAVVYAMAFNAEVAPVTELDRFRHVFLNCRREDGSGLAVTSDERRSGEMAADHLIAQGCRRLAAITGDPWQVASRERLAGFEAALARAGLPPALVAAGDWGHRTGAELAAGMMTAADPPDGLFCHNDIMARGAMAALAGMGLSVPGDVRVIGHDEREFARFLAPPLSSITLPHPEMAEAALDLLLAGAPPPDSPPPVPGELIARESSAG